MSMVETNKRMRVRIVVAWCLVAAWAVVIFFMSAHTGSDLDAGAGIVGQIKRWLAALAVQLTGSEVDIVSPLAHFCEYAVFGALLLYALACTRAWPNRKLLVLAAVLIASLYGITDEFHQYFVPDRACDPLDWLVDTTGATLGALVANAIMRAKGTGPFALFRGDDRAV